MNRPPATGNWFASSLLESSRPQGNSPNEFERLWRGFMTARAALGLVLVVLQGGILLVEPMQGSTSVLVSLAYFAAALATRLLTRPKQFGSGFDAQWIRTVGVDIVIFSILQTLHGSNINYSPLFALPVLMASILGSKMTAMGTAAGITLLLFAYAGWLSAKAPWEANALFLQAALTGAGCLVISFLASQLANRLADVQQNSRRNQLAATVQREVNALVIDSLSEGILVVDESSMVRSTNPAAQLLLGADSVSEVEPRYLSQQTGWQDLMDTVTLTFATRCNQSAEIMVHHAGQGPRRLSLRTRLTARHDHDTQRLCVIFVQDQRELQARIRTEKLASMGRMSAAVAHEIRNPLAAIIQANGLLKEDLNDEGQRRLSSLVQQNATRLENIVRDVLNLAQASSDSQDSEAELIDLSQTCTRICLDWRHQNRVTDELMLDFPAGHAYPVRFDSDHLRRVLVNLLDNALRYASRQPASVRVRIDFSSSGPPKFEVSLHVWSDGLPLEPSVERHLFEPFFSSESRSSGLGLYICRELCDRNSASIVYDRIDQTIEHHAVPGNEFSVRCKTRPVDRRDFH